MVSISTSTLSQKPGRVKAANCRTPVCLSLGGHQNQFVEQNVSVLGWRGGTQQFVNKVHQFATMASRENGSQATKNA
jgi:hypothetical protein